MNILNHFNMDTNYVVILLINLQLSDQARRLLLDKMSQKRRRNHLVRQHPRKNRISANEYLKICCQLIGHPRVHHIDSQPKL